MSNRRVFVMYGFDPTTGCASRPVGVVGSEVSAEGEPQVHVSWIPLEFVAAGTWRDRFALNDRSLHDVLGEWAEEVNGITADMELVEAEQVGDLSTVVEALVDELLGAQTED